MFCPGCLLGPLAGAFLGSAALKSLEQRLEASPSGKLATALRGVVKVTKFLKPCLPHSDRSNFAQIATTGASMGLTLCTALSVKKVFKIPLCGANGLEIKRFTATIAISSLVSIIYYLAINYLLNRYLPLPDKVNQQTQQPANMQESAGNCGCSEQPQKSCCSQRA